MFNLDFEGKMLQKQKLPFLYVVLSRNTLAAWLAIFPLGKQTKMVQSFSLLLAVM